MGALSKRETIYPVNDYKRPQCCLQKWYMIYNRIEPRASSLTKCKIQYRPRDTTSIRLLFSYIPLLLYRYNI